MEKNEIPILIYTFAIILSALGIFLLLFYLLFKKKQKTHKIKITVLNQELLQTQIEIQEQTLRNVSEEIHDNIGQALILAKLNLNTFINIPDRENIEKISATKQLIAKAINDLRDLARSMHGEKIAEIGLHHAVDNELKILQNTGQFQTHLSATGNSYHLKPQEQTVIFRIVQEALHNEIKHAKAKNIYASFWYEPAIFTLTLRDDGIGFNIADLDGRKTGIGLKNMKNRAALIGANFTIDSAINKGTTITIKLPIDISKIVVD